MPSGRHRKGDGEGADHIRTVDGSKIVAHMGADGHLVGGEGTLKAAVEPNTFYYLAISGGPNVMPVDQTLILAATVDDWFEPEE